MNSVTVNYMGGLGNQMFQFAVAYTMSKKFNKQLILPYRENLGNRPCYWNSFFSHFKKYLVPQLPSVGWFTYKDPKVFEYNVIPNYQFLNLHGYFQHPKYLDEYRNDIRENLFRWSHWESILKSKIPNFNFENCCSIHYRLGDYKKLSQVHPVMDDKYYTTSLTQIKDIDTYLIFCELEDIDTVKMRVNSYNLTGNIIYVCDFNLQDYEELILMSMCRVNIIANSSYSWLAAYFNNNENKQIFYPSLWMHGYGSIDIGSPRWIKV